MKELQCRPGVRAILNLVQDNNGCPCFKYCVRNQGRHHHDKMIDFERAGKNRSIAGILKEIQINLVLVIFFRKFTNREGFAALPTTLDNQRFVPRCFFPLEKRILYFSTKHTYTSLKSSPVVYPRCKLFQGSFFGNFILNFFFHSI